MKIRRSTTVVAVLAALAAIALAGTAVIGGDDAAPRRVSVTDSPAPTVDDRTSVARIVAAYVAPGEVVIEPAELLTGEEAAEAAAADGAEILDFYVRDHPEQRATLPVDDDVRVTVVDCTSGCEEGALGSYDTLTRTVEPDTLHRLTVRDGVVTAIDQIYLP